MGGVMPAPAKSAGQASHVGRRNRKIARSGISAGVLSGLRHSIERVGYGDVRVRWAFDEASLRPGGTVSGPTMMELADFAMYVAVFSAIGPQPLAVTTNLNINFLRKPARADLIADARLMKVGKRLAVGEVTIYSEGTDEPVAHVTATYSIPQTR